jgi:hypothetical protein
MIRLPAANTNEGTVQNRIRSLRSENPGASYWHVKTYKELLEMQQLDRFEFQNLLGQIGVTKTVLAAVAGVFKTDCTDYVKGRSVSAEKQERMVSALLDLAAWRKTLSFDPSMANADKVCAAVKEFRTRAESQLEVQEVSND